MEKNKVRQGAVNTTLQYYQHNADAFVEGTVSADMHDARTRFLKLLPSQAYILDFGCGSGRDTKAFLERGYRVDAIDGSAELCRIASELTGISVKQMLFEDLSAAEQYDGIWACASILHLPRRELVDVLQKISDALKAEGVLYTSFKYGDFEGIRSGRYFIDFTEGSFGELMEGIPSLRTVETWITKDVRPGRGDERWLNILLEKTIIHT